MGPIPPRGGPPRYLPIGVPAGDLGLITTEGATRGYRLAAGFGVSRVAIATRAGKGLNAR